MILLHCLILLTVSFAYFLFTLQIMCCFKDLFQIGFSVLLLFYDSQLACSFIKNFLQLLSVAMFFSIPDRDMLIESNANVEHWTVAIVECLGASAILVQPIIIYFYLALFNRCCKKKVGFCFGNLLLFSVCGCGNYGRWN